MKYKVVKEFELAVFVSIVQSLLDEGWTLQGGASIAVNGSSGTTYYLQALVK